MPNDGNLIIGIEAPQLQKVVNGMESLVGTTEKCVVTINNLTKTMQAFTSTTSNMASKTGGAFSQAQKELNAYKNKMLDVAAAGRFNGKVVELMTAKYNSLAGVVNNATRVVDGKINADKNAAKVAKEQAAALAQQERQQVKLAKEQAAAQKLAAKSGDYSQARNALSAFNLQLKDAIASGVKTKQQLQAMGAEQKILAAAVSKTDNEFRKLTSTGLSLPNIFRQIGIAGQVAFGNIISNAVNNAIYRFQDFIKSSSETSMQFDAMLNQFNAATGGKKALGGELFKESIRLAQEYGLAIDSISPEYAKFIASATRAGLSVQDVQTIFVNMNQTMTSMGLTAQRQELVWMALSQMASKGKISMEELRRQLGESLPGALEIMAQSMGVTSAELNRMVQYGFVGVDVLRNFSETAKQQLGTEFATAVMQPRAQMQMFKNDITLLKDEFGDRLNPMMVAAIDILRQFSPVLRPLGGLALTILDTINIGLSGIASSLALIKYAAVQTFEVFRNLFTGWDKFSGNFSKNNAELLNTLNRQKSSIFASGNRMGGTVFGSYWGAATNDKQVQAEINKINAQAAKVLAANKNYQKALSGTGTKSRASSTPSEAPKTAWDILNAELSAQEELIRSNLVQGKSIEKLIPDYMKLKKQQDDVNTSLQALTVTAPTLVDNWKQLEENLTKAEQAYKSMLSNSNQYTSAQIKEQESIMMGLKVQVQYNKKIEEATDLMSISSRTANQLADTLVDDLFTALGEGETVWSRFKDAGLAAFKALATDWTKKKLELMGSGFQAGWNVQSLYDKFTGQSGSLLKSLSSGLTGAAQGAKGEALGGTKDQPSALSDMLTQLQNLASAAGVTLPSALTTAASSITSLAAPATTAATALGQTATSALGMSTLSTVTTAMLGTSTAALPVFTAMATAITAIGAAASAAAIGMAELAVATAAAAAGIGAPAAAAATTTAIVGSNTVLAASYGQMALLTAGAKVIPHAKGGVVSSPTTFPMQGGNIGVAGEAGTEVIAPARRMSNGDLGVGAVAPNVTINNYANAAVEIIRRPDNETEIKITELNAMLSSSRTNKGMSNAQNRLSTKGRQVG